MYTSTQKGMAPVAIIGIIVFLALLVGGVYWGTTQESDREALDEMHDDVMMESDDTMIEGDDAMMDEGVLMGAESEFSGTRLAGSASAPLLDFTQADYEKALASEKLIALYFYANWCPTCRAEFPLMEQAFDKLETDQVVGFRVNFNDNETDADETALAREFGVAYQHTKVFVKNGERIVKSPESWDAKRYEKEITTNL